MRIVAVVLAVSVTAAVSAGDPSEQLAEAKRYLAGGNCEAATTLLERTLDDAGRLADEGTRRNALAAVHFYSAVAYSDCRKTDKARAALREFLTLTPGQSSLDRSKYSKEFVRLFDDALRAQDGGASFERFYGDFVQATLPAAPQLSLWGSTSEFILLGDPAEKLEWGRLRDDESRAAFIDRFWSRRGLGSEAEQNPARNEILRRIAFADRVFGGDRGSLTDRGRVFVLLGEPARVHRRAMRQNATTLHMRPARSAVTGVYERWVYFKPQLPVGVPASEVVFSFITDDHSDGALQRDFMPLKTLGEAAKALAQK